MQVQSVHLYAKTSAVEDGVKDNSWVVGKDGVEDLHMLERDGKTCINYKRRGVKTSHKYNDADLAHVRITQ